MKERQEISCEDKDKTYSKWKTKEIHHHKYQGLDPLIRSVSRLITALANVSSVFQLLKFVINCKSDAYMWKKETQHTQKNIIEP